MNNPKPPRLDLNPSSADRWTTCTASPQFIMDNWDKVPPSETVYNMEGTSAHEVAASFLQGREPRTEDTYCCPVPVDADMRWHGWNYAEYVSGLIAPGGRLLVEQKLPLWYMPGRNAIVDAAVINPDHLHIVDYKYGEGVIVSPENSLQATIYARCVVSSLSECNSLKREFPVTVHIYQPRSRNSHESPSHIWETTWAAIVELSEVATQASTWIKLAGESKKAGGKDAGLLQFKPSEKACQWCPAKGFCVARQEHLTRGIEPLAAMTDDVPMHFPPSKAVSLSQLSAILRHKSEIIRWLGDAEEYALEHMKAGNKIPGFKLVLSRGGNRYWSDPKKAAAFLLEQTILKREEVIEEKTIGPAAVEKKLGKHKFTAELMNLITKAPGSPCIAPEGDSRENIGVVDVGSEFEVITDTP